MASTYLTRSISSTGDRRKWTWSGWLKRTNIGSNYIFASNDGANQYAMLAFTSDQLRYYDYSNASSYISQLKTNRVFRDTNSWYHIVVTYDSAQGTASNRIKFYVNGVQETSFAISNYPSQNNDSYMNFTGHPHYLGRESGTSELFDGIMSHVHFCDGYAYSPSDFGSTDSTTGEWKLITSPSVSYGTNGYFMFKDNASLSDQSGQGNNFTLTAGTLTKTEDCPSNVFATLNALNQTNSNATFSHGNNTLAVSGNWLGATSTIGVFKGKWYFEAKSDGNNWGMGVAQIGQRFTRTTEISTHNTGYFGKYNDTWSFYNNGNSPYKLTNDTGSAYGSDFANGEIGMFALDADNGKIWAGKNGTWFESGDPANGTNAMYDSLDNSYGWLVGVFGENSTTQVNFGNGYFGTTAVSSAGTNASNLGIFEYDVPAGFTAICTKGLNL